MKEIDFLEVGGFKLGHAHDEEAVTGCSVLIFDEMLPAGVSIRGGGPASRETPLLNPLAAASGINAILLSGGSAFGLDAAGGVMNYLEAQGVGVDVGVTKVPLVCQSSLFDLNIGAKDVRPDANMALVACNNASKTPSKNGNIGAGMGCTVGKYRGNDCAMKSGLATYAVELAGLKVGAMVAVNALGDIFDPKTGVQIAGLRDANGLISTEDTFYNDIEAFYNLQNSNTTLGVIVTNAKFNKSELCKIAEMAQNGYARTIKPVHTTADGDSIFAASTGEFPMDINIVGTLAATVMAEAILRAVKSAKTIGSFIAVEDL